MQNCLFSIVSICFNYLLWIHLSLAFSPSLIKTSRHPCSWFDDYLSASYKLFWDSLSFYKETTFLVFIYRLSSKVMLKILQARLQQYVNHELTDVQAGFRKGRGTRDQIANIRWIIKKAREFQKNIYFCLLTMPKPLTVWITINCAKFWKRWEYQTTWPASWETCMQVRKQQLELDMEQQTGSK